MKTEIDRELVKQVTNCLAEKSEEKKRNFLFVPGSERSALVISKKKLGAGDSKEAKKTSGGTLETKGNCFGEITQDGTKQLVFIVKRLDEGLDRRLRKAIKENAGLTCNVEVRRGDVTEVEDKSTDQVSVPKEATQEQKDLANKARYKKMLILIGARVGLLQKYEPAKAKEFMTKAAPLLTKAEELVAQSLPEGQREYKKALEILIKLKSSVPVANDRPGKAGDAPDFAFGNKLREAGLLIKKLSDCASRFPVVEQARQLYRHASKLGRMMNFIDALPVLDTLITAVQQVLTRSLSCARVYQLLLETQNPEFAAVELAAFDGKIEAAMGLALPKIAAEVGKVEDEMRHAITLRGHVIEAAKVVQGLLQKGQGVLDPGKLNELQAAFKSAFEKLQTDGSAAASDAMGVVEASIRSALRLKEDGISEVKPMQQTEDVRRLKLEMNIQNLCRAADVLAERQPEKGLTYRRTLEGILQTSKTKPIEWGEANVKIVSDALQKDLNAMRKMRIGGRRGFRKPVVPMTDVQGTGHQSTEDWSRQIKDGNLLTRMTIGRHIKDGGFGKVSILDAPEGEDDAPPLIIKTPANTGTLQSLEDEGEIYKKVGDHPNLCKCLGIGEVGGEKGLILERVQGKQMDDYMKNLNAKLNNGELSESEYWGTIKYTLKKTMETLDFLHDRGFGHNDLKPGNIMMDEKTGELKIIDLGELNPLGAKVQGVDNPDYRAPEDFSQHTSTPQTDTFGAGATIFAAILEKPTFHYGNEEGMESGFVFERENVVQNYGQTGGDQSAFPPEGDVPEQQRSVNVGEQQFRELMNAMLHPDPSKRLSPKQALTHPFLSDSLMDDEQVKGIIQRLGQAPLED